MVFFLFPQSFQNISYIESGVNLVVEYKNLLETFLFEKISNVFILQFNVLKSFLYSSNI